MSIRLYHYDPSAGYGFTNGYVALSKDDPASSSVVNDYDGSPSGFGDGLFVQIAVKPITINDGDYSTAGADGTLYFGNKTQILSIPNALGGWSSESQYAENLGLYIGSDGSIHIQLQVSGVLADYGSSTGLISAGNWYRICAGVSSAGALSVWVNGTLAISESLSPSTLSAFTFIPILGRSIDPSSDFGWHLNGELDSFYVWGSNITGTDAQAMGNGISPFRASSPPVMAFRFPADGVASFLNLTNVMNGPVMQTLFMTSASFLPGQSLPPFVSSGQGHQQSYAFDNINPIGTSADRIALSDTATSTALLLVSASAVDTAKFTGAAIGLGERIASTTDSFAFTGIVSGGVHAIRQLPSEVGSFADLAAASVSHLYGGPSVGGATFSDTASGAPIGDKAVSVSGGGRFFDQARAGGSWVVSASDTATFTDTLVINGVVAFAADNAVFSGAPSARSPYHAYDTATFSDVAHAGLPSSPASYDTATFSESALGRVPVIHVQRVEDSFVFLFTLASVHDTSIFVGAMDSATFSDDSEWAGLFGYAMTASDSAFLIDVVQTSFLRVYSELPPTTKGRFSDIASSSVLRLWKVAAADSFRLSDLSANVTASLYGCVTTDAARFTDLASDYRKTQSSASDTGTLSGSASSNALHVGGALDSAKFSDAASDEVSHLGASNSVSVSDRADASVLLPAGTVIPGGDQASGLRQVLWPSLSTEFPATFAESAEGLLLVATGVDEVVAWDGNAPSAWCAGLDAPDTVVWLEAVGVGSIFGNRYAYIRWVDVRGNTSNLSQISDALELGGDGFIDSVSYTSSEVVVRSVNHGLTTGSMILILGIMGLPSVNGQWTITVIDADTFSLNGLIVSGGAYAGGGIWSNGAASISYTNVPVPTDPKIARRQILRNLAGNAACFYVDVDTDDLVSTEFYSSLTDEQLATNLAVPILFNDSDAPEERLYRDMSFARRSPAATRFGKPPSWKCSLAAYSGRVWAAADRVYETGNVSVTLGSLYVIGLGTDWNSALAGRLLYVEGAEPQVIESVLPDSQILVLETAYQGPSQLFGFYTIRPAPVERLLVYYSEPHLPEAWPPWNAFSVPETSDEITALVVIRSFLYVVKERSLFKFAFKEDPGRDGYAFPIARRGCVNARCFVLVDDGCYFLDESGVYSFEKDEINPISQDVQILFKSDADTLYQVDWTTDRTLWHAIHDPARETIRWFVDFVGQPSLTMSVCYDYRRRFWWLEQYPESVTSSALCVTSGYRQATVGTTGRRVYCLGQGTLDGIQESLTGTLSGIATDADSLSLTDISASFPANLAGVPVALVSGTGAGQQAIISSNTSTTIVPVDPWEVVPDTTTTYQIGGVSWTWRSGWRRLADDEAENPRDLEFVFRPTPSPSSFAASVYYDHSPTPEEWGYDLERDGITIVQGGSAITVNMSVPRGYAIQRMSGHRDPYGFGHRYLALELNGVQGVDPQRVYQLVINGAE